jgi:hypothetical protein
MRLNADEQPIGGILPTRLSTGFVDKEHNARQIAVL